MRGMHDFHEFKHSDDGQHISYAKKKKKSVSEMNLHNKLLMKSAFHFLICVTRQPYCTQKERQRTEASFEI